MVFAINLRPYETIKRVGTLAILLTRFVQRACSRRVCAKYHLER